MKKAKWIIFAIFCISISLYPLMYILVDWSFFIDNNAGFLATKSPELLSSTVWKIAFYGHIIFGGISLMIGWTQFSTKWRIQNVALHRTIGKIYIIWVLISGLCGIGIAVVATGGIISQLGFVSLGVIWLSTTIVAFIAIKNSQIERHKNFMIYSYAACFAAVTLRIWLPLLTMTFQDFIVAYRIVAWLCWVPNIIVAYFIVSRNTKLELAKVA